MEQNNKPPVASDDEISSSKLDSDSARKRRYGRSAFLIGGSHCSAPSSSPRSTPPDQFFLTDLNPTALDDALRSYSRETNEGQAAKQSDENPGGWWIEFQSFNRNEEIDNTIQVQASMSPEGGGESGSTKSDLDDVIESAGSSRSKFEVNRGENEDPINYPRTPTKRQNVGLLHQNLTLSHVQEPKFPLFFTGGLEDRAISSSAPASTIDSLATVCLPQPSMYNMSSSPSGHVELNTISYKNQLDEFDDFPTAILARFFDQLHRPAWVVPVLPNQELEILLEIGIRLVRKGLDGASVHFNDFLNRGLLCAFDKLMNDVAMKEWKRCIWMNAARFMIMFVEKMTRSHGNDVEQAFWIILHYTMNNNSRFNMHNFGSKVENLQIKCDSEVLCRFTSASSVDDQNQIWLLLLLDHFGKIKGFEMLKSYLEKSVSECTAISNYIDWLRPFATCSLIKPSVLLNALDPAIKSAVSLLRNMSDEDMKCETVKGELGESPLIELARILHNLLMNDPEVAEQAREMQLFSLRYILRVLQVAPFAGRIAALEELHVILQNAYQEFSPAMLQHDELTTWLKEQSVIEILVRDNLHHPAYCERLEKVFRVLVDRNAITVDDLDVLWAAQNGKHDAIQRNIHEMISKLANLLTNDLREHLFEQLKGSWANSSARERTLLLDLIRGIGIDYENGSGKIHLVKLKQSKLALIEHRLQPLTYKCLSLLWDLFRDQNLPVDMIDAALDAHFIVLKRIRNSEFLRREYIDRCIEELISDSVFVVPALKHLQRLLIISPEDEIISGRKTLRAEYIANVQQETELCSRLSHNIALYMKKVREIVQNECLPTEMDASSIMLDKRYAHNEHLQTRLTFLHFLLCDGQLWLMTPQANELWDALVVNAVFEFERTFSFLLFATMQDQDDIDPKALELFFNSRILHLPAGLLNEEGFVCFKTFWISVNRKRDKLFQPPDSSNLMLNSLELEGYDYLWEIILKSNDCVSRLGTELWVQIFSNPHTEVISDFTKLNDFVISKCFAMMKNLHDNLIKGVNSEVLRNCHIKQISRILIALHSYICAIDDECYMQERLRQPLLKASIGSCFLLTIHFPADQLLQLRKRYDHKLNVTGFEFSSSCCSQSQERIIAVHGNMQISALKLKVDDCLRSIEPSIGFSAMGDIRLAIQRFDAVEDSKLLTARDWRKTLNELGIDAVKQIIVRCTHNFRNNWVNSLPSANSSPVRSDDVSPFGEEDEQVLPGTAISSNSEQVRYLFTLADIGYEYGSDELRDAAMKVLQQIPADAMSITIIDNLVAKGRLLELFPAESSTQALYLLRVLHSLLLPCSAHFQTAATDFQIKFFTTSSCMAIFEFLSDPKILCRWDFYACNSAILWLMSMAKFVLFVIARLKHLKTCDDNGGCFETNRVIGNEQTVFKDLCTVVAQDLLRRIGDDPVLIEYVVPFFDANENRIMALMRIAWAVGSRRIPLVDSMGHFAVDSSMKTILVSQTMVGKVNSYQEEPTLLAMEALATGVVSENAAFLMLRNLDLWSHFLCDLLFCKSVVIRQSLNQIVRRIVCRVSSPERVLIVETVNILFNKLEESDEKVEKNAEFFNLLCRLLLFCASEQINIGRKVERFTKIVDWLNLAKEHTITHQESYPDDNLLIGHLDVCRCLIMLLNIERKSIIGSEFNFIKKLLEEFVLPSSRSYIDSLKARENGSHILRSLTHSALSGRDSKDVESSLPRSATMGAVVPNRFIPVCGTSESVKAVYNVLLVLCEDVPANYEILINVLLELFYFDAIPTTNIEWDYLPGYTVRSPNSYVGLKNGGATCYMNSVFQQVFMIEPVRNAVINANCAIDTYDDEEQNTEVFLFRDEEPVPDDQYYVTILRAVQTIFAHLLGSEMQYYSPKYFWDKFRFCGQQVNLREQQDALEFYNALFNVIDEGLKKVGATPICEKLFGGTFADQKICKDCPHRSQREEAFTSISVDIRSHNNLLDSLKEYVKGDLLNNDNAYFCEQCNKKVTAVKRLCVAKLPPYLTIQLKRFDFDYEHDVSQKFNDYFEFPVELDMMPYTAYGLSVAESISKGQGEALKEELPISAVDSGQGTSTSTSPDKVEVTNAEDGTKSESNGNTNYRLRGVVVHSGQATGGHYYSFIRSDEDGGRWFKFDDIEVTEWHPTKEELRNMWFGGDYCLDSLDTSSIRSQKKRQKRWWNAYLLFYEKAPVVVNSITSSVADMTTSCSSVAASSVSSVSPLNLDKRIGAMSISNRIRQMPPKLEALIRGKNTRSMHERAQYCVNYFLLIKEICSGSSRMLEGMNYTEKEEHCLLIIKLLGKFVFTTGLHAKKALRAGCLSDWQKTFESLLKHSEEARAWFVCNILLQSKLISLYLFSAPSIDIRHFFINVLVAVLNETAFDHLSSLEPYITDCPDFNFDMVCSGDDTVSDMLISLLLVVTRNSFAEFSSHPVPFFALLNNFAQCGTRQKRQLISRGTLHSLLLLTWKEKYRVKISYQDLYKLYDVISILLRSCNFKRQSENGRPNPYASSVNNLVDAPQPVVDLFNDLNFISKFSKQIIELPYDHSTPIEALLYMCWENIPFCVLVLQNLPLESIITPNEVKHVVLFIEKLLSMNDSVQSERQCIILLGLENTSYNGHLTILLSQKEICTWKAYILFKMLVYFTIKNDEFAELIRRNDQVLGCFTRLCGWLKTQLAITQPNYNTFCRSNESKTSPLIERTDSAINLVEKCEHMKMILCEGRKNDEEPATTSAETVVMNEDISFDSRHSALDIFTSLKRDSASDEKKGKIQSAKDCSFSDLTTISEVESGVLPPPPYSEEDQTDFFEHISSSPIKPVSSLDASHSRPINTRLESGPSADEFHSTGIEKEDALPSYDESVNS